MNSAPVEASPAAPWERAKPPLVLKRPLMGQSVLNHCQSSAGKVFIHRHSSGPRFVLGLETPGPRHMPSGHQVGHSTQ